MKHSRLFATLALVAGLALPGAASLSAADWHNTPTANRDNYSNVRVDTHQIDRLRAEIAQDRARLNEDMRHGRPGTVARDRQELARDQRALDALLRDTHTDRGYRNSYR